MAFFLVFLYVRRCCRPNHLSADDETSNVLKRLANNICSRFGSLRYIEIRLIEISSLKFCLQIQQTQVEQEFK